MDNVVSLIVFRDKRGSGRCCDIGDPSTFRQPRKPHLVPRGSLTGRIFVSVFIHSLRFDPRHAVARPLFPAPSK
ncbi:hypothetical protein MANES_05G117502v8 [Manihot esculenta]|uniref:Uncharacterized protein n=2 Tax=Manihot esculenta TaxID=3983 RepID=A0ACB7HP53_MANES|nr:hypothetical protein MANES_05G117502v8 [Manihot esculenta]KAG8654282.1 hypothetical protein MANES_05G117502v8 [Manihot esculenta]